jgi:PAS domain S-box-containing protein
MDPLRTALDSLTVALPASGFLPHAYCFLWDRDLIGLHVISDAIVALSYYSIPVVLLVFYAQRVREGMSWILVLFAAFILACGTTHLMSIYTLWVPAYWLDGAVKAATALLSVSTAIIMWPMLPRFLAIPEPGRLAREIAERSAAEQRYRQFVELNPHATVVVDREGTVQLVNTQTLAWFGYERGELVGKPVDVLIPHRFRAHHPEFLAGFFRAPSRRPMGTGRSLFGLRKDGSEFPVDISLSPVETPDGVQVIASIADITERKEAEENLRRANQAFEAVNKELEAFAYSVSHDLRAPLRAMIGFGQILQEEHAQRLDVEARDYLHRIIAASQRMGDLIDGLLVLSRIARGTLQKEPVYLSTLARSIVEEHSRADPGRKVEIVVHDGLKAIGDPRLERVLLNNLLGNAWKFTAKASAPKIEFGSTRADGVEVFFVRDNGAGFDMAYADKLFGAFQRLHNADEFPGTGIGLATAQRIVNRHGGRIWAEGKVGEGATFYFTL